MTKTSKIHNFHELSIGDRIKIIGDFCGLNKEKRLELRGFSENSLSYTENAVGPFLRVLRCANNFKINGRDYFIPIEIEEASVVASASYGAKLCYDSGGIQASVNPRYPKAVGQIQLIDVKNPEKARKGILDNKSYLLEKAREGHEYSNPYDLDVETFCIDAIVVNLHIDPGDAMGAAVASDMVESIAPELSKIAETKYLSRGTISNYSGRLTKAELKVPIEKLARKSKITGEEWSGEDVKEGILQYDKWAKEDFRRAVSHNKGIMNGVIGVANATAQDTRAIEAANAAYACKNCRYQPLSSWHADNEYLYGESKMLIPCGIVGGEIKNYPKAEFLLKGILKVETADNLAEIIASTGIASNLAALSMNTTIGLEEGHGLHRR